MSSDKVNYLFVYGTLLNLKNPYGQFLQRNSKFISNGKVRGKLYHIGEYPGLLASDKSGGYVYGAIVYMNTEADVLKVLDDYEGYGCEQIQPNEFVRTTLPIEADGDIVDCWVYLYNLPTDGFPEIPSGIYTG